MQSFYRMGLITTSAIQLITWIAKNLLNSGHILIMDEFHDSNTTWLVQYSDPTKSQENTFLNTALNNPWSRFSHPSAHLSSQDYFFCYIFKNHCQLSKSFIRFSKKNHFNNTKISMVLWLIGKTTVHVTSFSSIPYCRISEIAFSF